MISYRLYCLEHGQVIDTTAFEAADDVAAIEQARARRNPFDCELWCDHRLVAFIPAASDPASSEQA